MKKNGTYRILSVLLAAVLVLGLVLIPGAGLTAEAKKKSKKKTSSKTTTTATTTAKTPTYQVSIPAALISGDQVTLTVTASTAPATDDGIYHIFAQDCYESGAAGTEVAQLPAAAGTQTTNVALGLNSASSMLYKKFVVLGSVGGKMTQLSNCEYISNPEAAASASPARLDTNGKKGLLLDSGLINRMDILSDVGVDQVTYNLNLGDLLSDSSRGWYTYNYNGKTYQFAKAVVDQFGIWIVPPLNKKGISVTIILLNNLKSNTTLIHPQAMDGTVANYYAFNTANAAGAETIEAIGAFLGEKFNGKNGWGQVDNWIIGNEVNARQEWGYINAAVGEDYAVKAYADAVRLFYNGIKSKDATANVYVGVDHEWSRSDGYPDPSIHYGAQSFLTKLNSYVASEGNFNWGVATHPYNAPLYSSWTINPGIVKPNLAKYVTDDQSSVYITMYNIDVLTDFLCQKAYLQSDGQVRSVLCSELGYTSLPSHGYASDESIQAAALAYGYWQAMNNQYIDGFFNREVDHATEINEISEGQPDNLATGILNMDATPKQAYTVYKNIDDPNQQAAILQQAAASFGVADLTPYIHVR